MKHGISSQISFTVALVGITCTTIGHYAEVWVAGYAVAGFFALVAADVFIEQEGR